MEGLWKKRRLLDLFSGEWGWSRIFAARGWECTGIDWVRPGEIPLGCRFIERDILMLDELPECDFIVASSPCEEFSVHRMRHFHPDPRYPERGIRLFNHTRALCEASRVPYVMENVYGAQKFVGQARHHCGAFYLWGTGVPPLMPGGILKNMNMGSSVYAKGLRGKELAEYRKERTDLWAGTNSRRRKMARKRVATIAPELANCVADYAERILERADRITSTGSGG